MANQAPNRTPQHTYKVEQHYDKDGSWFIRKTTWVSRETRYDDGRGWIRPMGPVGSSDIVFRGSLAECESYIRMAEGGYIKD